MPLDRPELAGTESNGLLSNEYCKYCYERGNFTNDHMTLPEMKIHVRKQMEKRKVDENIISMAIGSLPFLKRWALAKASL
jgi:hypothetical protein